METSRGVGSRVGMQKKARCACVAWGEESERVTGPGSARSSAR